MKTTYYLMLTTGDIWRATSWEAKRKLARLAITEPSLVKAILPKDAKKLITIEKRNFVKIKNIV